MRDRLPLLGLARILERRVGSSTVESAVQEGVANVLSWGETAYEREVRLSDADRIDFLLADGTGIEVKVAGSLPALLRQLQRYAQHDRVRALLVVTTRTRLMALPEMLSGKPVAVASLLTGGL